ncbi:hypothetical protein [Lishizhenia tianjinensis]|nr:hypothetical protein [Lishizhenia tianjinensis]
MKHLLITLLLFPFGILAQYKLDSIGLNDDILLNTHEVLYLKELLSKHDSVPTLENQRIHFAANNWGAKHLSKSAFFNTYCKPRTEAELSMSLVVLVLTPEEREELKVDVMIVAWSKITPVGRARKKFIANIKNSTSEN